MRQLALLSSVSRTLVFWLRPLALDGDLVVAQTPPSPIPRQSSCLDEPREFKGLPGALATLTNPRILLPPALRSQAPSVTGR